MEKEVRFWGVFMAGLGFELVDAAAGATCERRGDLAGGAAGKGSKGSKAPKDWIESPLGLGTKLRGREERFEDSLSLSPPYMSPMASVTWWLSSLMEIWGAWPRRIWYTRSSSRARSEAMSGRGRGMRRLDGDGDGDWDGDWADCDYDSGSLLFRPQQGRSGHRGALQRQRQGGRSGAVRREQTATQGRA